MAERSARSHLRLAVPLGMTVGLAPLALDTYLPAFPAIADAFGADLAGVGLTLSIYIAVLGASQLIGGPLSDRYGRSRVLVGGLAVFVIASLMIARADELTEMLLWRAAQAVGGGFCAVSVPAIVRDNVRGNEAARLFSLIGLVMFVAPALAPSIGSLVLAASSWPVIFLFLAAYAVFLALLLRVALFRRMHPHVPVRTPLRALVTNYALVLRETVAMRFILIHATVFSVLMVFVTHASFIYQEWFGLPKAAFAALFACNVAGMASANLLNRRLLRSLHSVLILRTAVAVQTAAVLGLTGVVLLGNPPVAVAAPLFILTMACMGAVAPNTLANALELFPTLGGTAAALLGATQFALAGLVSALSTRLADGTLVPIAAVMSTCALLALALALTTSAPARRSVLGERSDDAAGAKGATPGGDGAPALEAEPSASDATRG